MGEGKRGETTENTVPMAERLWAFKSEGLGWNPGRSPVPSESLFFHLKDGRGNNSINKMYM